jgi:hypothetical protein
MRDAMLKFDESKLIQSRKAGEIDEFDLYGWGSFAGYYTPKMHKKKAARNSL